MPEPKSDLPTAPRVLTDARLVARIVPWVLGLGVVTRAISYVANRSLWLDESMIALNIDGRSFLGLAGTLDFSQAAPLGFLWLEKLSVTVLGVSEFALRLWPYIAGVTCLFLVDTVASRILRPAGRLFTVSLLALSGSLIYYSSEAKQYSFDVALAAFVLLAGVAYGARLLACEAEEEPSGHTRTPWLGLALVGAVGVWFSHPLVFVLPGMLLYLWLTPGPRSSRLKPLFLTAALWGVSFAAAFYLTARGASQNPVMARFWAEGFMPLPPTSSAEVVWFLDAASGWIRNTLDFAETESQLHTIGILCGFVLAVVGIGRGWVRDRRTLLLIALPIGVALLASALRLYPFKGRLSLFLVPSTVLLMGWGVDAGVGWLRRRVESPEPAAGAVAMRATFLTLAFAVLVSAASITWAWSTAPYREELRPVLTQMAERIQPGDLVYLHSGTQHAALFYERACEACRLTPALQVRGRFPLDGEEAVRAELAGLPESDRLWAVFSHEWWGFGDEERDEIVAQLEARAGAPDTIQAPGAEAFLFAGMSAAASDPRLRRLSVLGLGGAVAAMEPLARELALEARDEGRIADAHWLALRPAYVILYGLQDAPRALAAAETLFEDFPFDRATAESGLVLADFFARAGQVDRARLFAESWLSTRAIENPHAPLARLQALLSLATGDPGSAVARLRSVASRADGCDACVAFDLGVAYEVLAETDSAIVSFERYVAASEPTVRSTRSFGQPYAVRRLIGLYEKRAQESGVADSTRIGALARARALQDQLDHLWGDADPEFLSNRSNER